MDYLKEVRFYNDFKLIFIVRPLSNQLFNKVTAKYLRVVENLYYVIPNININRSCIWSVVKFLSGCTNLQRWKNMNSYLI